MRHKNCGGDIILDCSSMYSIASPSINISVKGITPGVLEIISCKKKEPAKLICSKCNETFSDKEKFESEIEETCSVCAKPRSPSEIKIAENLSIFVCTDCSEKSKSKKLNPDIHKDRLLMYYGQIINKAESVTLLTILMKK